MVVEVPLTVAVKGCEPEALRDTEPRGLTETTTGVMLPRLAIGTSPNGTGFTNPLGSIVGDSETWKLGPTAGMNSRLAVGLYR